MKKFNLQCMIAFWCLCVAVSPTYAGENRIKFNTLIWGSLVAPSSVRSSDSRNASFETFAKINTTVAKPSDRTKLTAYVLLGVKHDRLKLAFNSKGTASVGLEYHIKLSDALRVSFGGRYGYEHQLYTSISHSSFVWTADAAWYKQWEPDWLKRSAPSGSRLVFSGWANMRGPAALDPLESDNVLLQASTKLAVSIPIKKTKLKFAPFISFKAKADTAKRVYSNNYEPALGLDLKVPFAKNGDITFGTKLAHNVRTRSNDKQSGILTYISWYITF